MAFNPSSENEKRAVVNPKNLRFTQLDIAPSFTDPEHPKVIEAISLILRHQLDPAVFGELTVHRDKQLGVVWCENNRRLYVLRKAGIPSVRVKFVNNDYMSRRIKDADKITLNDPDFMPRIRGELSGVQTDQEQNETSLLGVVGSVSAALVAGYWGWKLYNSQKDNDDDDDGNHTISSAKKHPKDLRFTQLSIKSTFTDPTHPSVRESVSLIRKGKMDPVVFGELIVHEDEQGVVWCKNSRRLFVLKEAGVSSVRVKFISNEFSQLQNLTEADKKKLDDPDFRPKVRGQESGVQIPPPPTSGLSVFPEQKETSLLDAVGSVSDALDAVGSVSAALVTGYRRWKLYNGLKDNGRS
ncbi:hypothetical protein SUGI_0092270 [Cryptomeria japonica]|nr:hypothetical protein SUGI_0092270 [Cryptomeria japonica]